MRIVKRHLAALLIGSLGVVGFAYAGAQALSPSGDTVVLAQEEKETRGRSGGMHRPMIRGALRGEFVVPGEQGTFRTVRIDRGVVERIDGSTVVIKEDDGTVVEVATSDETRIARDGEAVEVSTLQAGDHVFAHRVDDGDGLVTKSVRAFSPERWAEMEQRREECRANPRQCRADRRSRAPGREAPAA